MITIKFVGRKGHTNNIRNGMKGLTLNRLPVNVF